MSHPTDYPGRYPLLDQYFSMIDKVLEGRERTVATYCWSWDMGKESWEEARARLLATLKPKESDDD